MKRNDTLWKSILEDIFDDFLRFFFPDAETLFDFQRGFEYLDKELEQLFPPDDCKDASKYVDKLVKVYSLTGAEEWVLVHIEVQGYRDVDFADRMFTYYYRIWDKYRKPITAFAILTDDCRHYLPVQFEQHCLGTSLCFRFNSFKVLDQSDEALAASDNPFAQAVLVTKTALIGKKLSIDELYRLKIQLARGLLNRDIPKWKIGKLMNFLQFYVRFDSEELDTQFNLEVDEIIHQKKIPMTLEEAILQIVKEEGIERGHLERNTTIVQNLLRETNFSTEQIARLVGVSVEFVNEIRQSHN
ncbi:RpnC/YadD family protein [Dyadobacter sp. MSC1_007]|jgi:predicted transposase YdaD|uniref:hypothetical protein n=1 Tax=Dyadobacter sp. MSC1_007 TaxID=2909264 RepID=UPI0020309562|nr:hypothetical protein [Dyadobacter sp. MSC1_007]